MIAWLNSSVLLISSMLFMVFYIRSVSPAGMEKTLPGKAYQRCYHLRVVAILFEIVTVVCFVFYYYNTLPVPLPVQFPWSWWISLTAALIIGIPALFLMVIGMKDAGAEASKPSPEHVLFSGIYEKIRHPQAAGEVFLWLVIALLLNSPFLVLFSLIYFPIFILLCWAEEQDLLLRYGEPYAEYMRNTGAFWPKKRN